MSEHKHTPGPWQFGGFELYEGSGKRFNISQAEGAAFTYGYSDVAQTIEGERLSVQEANARLIAAAPELLDALRELVACKRMKEQIAIQQGLVIETDEDMEEMDRIMSDYARRQPRAWENAALILAKATGATHD